MPAESKPDQQGVVTVPAGGAPAPASRKGQPLFDISGIDLTARLHGPEHIAKYNPHRGQMAMLDAIVWENPSRLQGIAVKRLRDDEFWVAGHFPGKPMFPGVLMIETGAQLACYLFMTRRDGPSLVAFLRIEECAFRTGAKPGDDFYVLCDEVKVGRRSFVNSLQGIVDGRIAFDATISGMMIDPVQTSG